ncbi:TIGR03086 family metal-binding protein [Nocardioides alcanivorans]|uniref:TIGR03086 family metal-binding protein n=1 Tax=Nocardioides alcanivorans TaxID=2897352 RepID=UPI001F4284DB|nr:TIGR03086 family metal-binding protein [Nocardioides alcanivorans]
MTDTLDSYLNLADRFGELVSRLPDDSWSANSPCEGWTAADVLDHVVDSQRDFFARHSLELGERPSAEDPAELWATHDAAVRRALGDGSVLTREFDSFFGPSTIGATLSTFFGLDLVIHRWDIATAAGVGTEFTNTEMDHVEACLDELGANIYAHGACSDAVPVPADASRQDQLVARTGRQPA